MSKSSNEDSEYVPSKPSLNKQLTRYVSPINQPINQLVQSYLNELTSKYASSLTPDLTVQPQLISTASLHSHQLIALNWLKQHYQQKINCILADDMGLGKTLTSISLLAWLTESIQLSVKNKPNNNDDPNSRIGPFLIISPLSVLDNWSTEFTNFCPTLKVQRYEGDKNKRAEIQEKIRKVVLSQPKTQRKDPVLPFNVLLTSYELVMKDAEFLSRFQWRIAVIDESHRLKSETSILYQSLLNDYNLHWKLLLTGTPVQNNIRELWALLHFLEPKLFNTNTIRTQFLEEFSPLESGIEDTLLTKDLQEIVKPFLLRRTKFEVMNSGLGLPSKRELILKAGLTDLQKKFYKFIITKNAAALGATGNSRGLLNIISSLRKASSHPYLFSGAEPEPFQPGDHLWQSSGKFILLEKLLKKLHADNHKVLIFSTSVQTLDIVQDYLSFKSYTYERLDGSVRGEERYLAINRYKESAETFVFLLSTRAGGVGLNLTVADTCIFLDQDYNPQLDLQAQARIHRIGQTKPVLIIRLVSANTVEEVIQRRSLRKLLMTNQILGKGTFNTNKNDNDYNEDNGNPNGNPNGGNDGEILNNSNSADDLRSILQFGLDKLFETNDFTTMEIDKTSSSKKQILSQNDQNLINALNDEDIEAIVNGVQLTNQLKSTIKTLDTESITNPTQSIDIEFEDDQKYNNHVQQPSDSIYVYNGRDYSNYDFDAESDREYELESKQGKQTLNTLIQHAQTMKEQDQEDNELSDFTRKRKAKPEESPEERAERLANAKRMKEERAAVSAVKRAEKEAQYLEELQMKWLENGYQSLAIQDYDEEATLTESVDEKVDNQDEGDALNSTFERQFEILDDEDNTNNNEQNSEWTVGDADYKTSNTQSDNNHGKKKSMIPLEYVVGDASIPFSWLFTSEAENDLDLKQTREQLSQSLSNNNNNNAAAGSGGCLILNVIDNSGNWSSRGFFGSLGRLSNTVAHSYELAGRMDDLKIGQAHLVEVLDQIRDNNHFKNSLPSEVANTFNSSPISKLRVYVVHIIAQSRSKKGSVSSIQLDALSHSLNNISRVAAEFKFSVHLPRLGTGSQSTDWYSLEKMLKKYFAARSIPAYIYYFRRKQNPNYSPVKRAQSISRSYSITSDSSVTSTNFKLERSATNTWGVGNYEIDMTDDNQNQNSNSSNRNSKASRTLNMDTIEDNNEIINTKPDVSMFEDIFSNYVFYLDIRPPNAQQSRLLNRYILAHNGTVVSSVSNNLTHVLSNQTFLDSELKKIQNQIEQANNHRKLIILAVDWLQDCINNKRIDYTSKFTLKEPKLFENQMFYINLIEPAIDLEHTTPSERAVNSMKYQTLQRRLPEILSRAGGIVKLQFNNTDNIDYIVTNDINDPSNQKYLTQTVHKNRIQVVTNKWIETCIQQANIVDTDRNL